MTTDRIERVREKARESAPDYFPSHDQFGFAVEGASDGQRGYLDGAVFGADTFRTLDDTEWKAMREKVARVIHMADQNLYGVGTDWDGMADWWRATMESYADAAMTAMGFRREGE